MKNIILALIAAVLGLSFPVVSNTNAANISDISADSAQCGGILVMLGYRLIDQDFEKKTDGAEGDMVTWYARPREHGHDVAQVSVSGFLKSRRLIDPYSWEVSHFLLDEKVESEESIPGNIRSRARTSHTNGLAVAHLLKILMGSTPNISLLGAFYYSGRAVEAGSQIEQLNRLSQSSIVVRVKTEAQASVIKIAYPQIYGFSIRPSVLNSEIRSVLDEADFDNYKWRPLKLNQVLRSMMKAWTSDPSTLIEVIPVFVTLNRESQPLTFLKPIEILALSRSSKVQRISLAGY